jgi:glycosidase
MTMDRREMLGLTMSTVMGAALSAAGCADEPAAAFAGLRHDSRDLRCKSPFGAVPAGSRVRFAIDADGSIDAVTLVIERRRLEGNQDVLEYREVARVAMERAGTQWTAQHRFDEAAVYGYSFEVRAGGRTWLYQNNADTVPWTREKGSNGVGSAGELPPERAQIRRFRLTVHRTDFTVPSWARDAIYYYIFPERFRNGDRRNDPQPGVDTYEDHDVEFHTHWLDKPYRPHTRDGSDEVYNNDFFGGDIAGIIDKLDYIAELGANTLYITPMFRAASNHKYDTCDYKHIDPHFGTDEDFTRLCREAAKRGMRVIPDTSLNHTGSDSIYFDRYGKYHAGGAFEGGRVNPASPYADWYRFDPTQPSADNQYKGWLGVPELPEVNKASPSFRHFAYRAPDSVMKLWLDRGASGWRMDVAPWVPDDFWREWRAEIKRHRPDALTIAETWFDASKFFLGDTFDSTMNYIFRNSVLDYASGADARQVYRNIELMREAYPAQAFHALMNLLSSHDVARTLHVFGYEGDHTPPAKIAEAKQRLRLAVFFQMVFPGAPAVYYGDEVGMTGGDDPYNRGPYPWPDQGGRPDTALLADFKRLIALRKRHEVLRHAPLEAPLHLDQHAVVLLRRLGDRWALTATNNDAQPHSMLIPLPSDAPAGWTDALDDSVQLRVEEGRLAVTVPPIFGLALVNR